MSEIYYEDNVKYDVDDSDYQEYHEERYIHPMDEKEVLEVVALHKQVAQQQKMDAQESNITALQEMVHTLTIMS